MADVVSAVRTYILSKTAVTDLIGQRLYLDRLPQGATLPAATIFKISERDTHGISDRAGFVHCRLQISCHSTSRLTTEALADAIRSSGLCAQKGTVNSVVVHGVTVEDGKRNYVLDARDGSDDHEYVTDFDFMVSYSE